MAKQLSKLWDVVQLDDTRQISHAGLLMMFALDDLKRVDGMTPVDAVCVWRRYCASNLTEPEWTRTAWNRHDADTNGMRALRELAEAVGVINYGRIHPTQYHLVERHRVSYAAAMPVGEFTAYCKATYARKAKLAD